MTQRTRRQLAALSMATGLVTITPALTGCVPHCGPPLVRLCSTGHPYRYIPPGQHIYSPTAPYDYRGNTKAI